MSKLLLRLAMLLALGTGFAAYGAHAGDGEYRWDIVGYRTFIADYHSAPTLAKILELEHRVTTGLENSRLSDIYCSIILKSLDHDRHSKDYIKSLDSNAKARALLDTIAEEKAARLKTVSMDSSGSSSSSEGDRYGGGSASGYIDDCP